MITKTTKDKTFTYKVCRTARVTRDARYDGLIFSGSVTTKIYCRPICPGKPPLESNNIYFQNGAQAEAAGFRPCLRCRPELAPGNLIRNADTWEVRSALGRIHQGILSGDAFDANAAKIKRPAGNMPTGFQAAVGTTLTNYWKTFRLGFAKMLLTDTALSMEDITSAAGFDSIRGMLDALANLYLRDPLRFRKPLPVHTQPGLKSCALMLAYRPPLNWSALLDYFRARAIAGVEKVKDEVYQRSFCLNGHTGWISLQNPRDLNAVRLEVHSSSLGCLMQVFWRVRRMLDLDADPLTLQSQFHKDSVLGPAWWRHPGVRVPVGWDAFEFAVRAIVGQLVSLGVATKLMGRISDSFSEDLGLPAPKGIEKVFPGPACLRGADVQPCGLTRNKTGAIAALARAVDNGTLNLETTTDLDTFIRRCTSFPGIGEWTAQTIAMRGLGDPDAFPAGDLGIVKALSADGRRLKPAHIRKMAEHWRPWRAYAAMLLWMM
jgi:AraC family transcriptional regulator of adaptative response / DNA-3-methyladenine glycosylase II